MIYIISYPRSGNTAMRYIVELLTKKPSNGLCGKPNSKDHLQQPVIHKKRNDYVAHKRHDFKGVTSFDTIFLIIRDYKEAIIRHNKGKRPNYMGQIDNYCQLIDNYQQLLGQGADGMVIYYEELMRIAQSESEGVYANSQSKGPHTHKNEVTKRYQEQMDQYCKEHWPQIWEKYLKHYAS